MKSVHVLALVLLTFTVMCSGSLIAYGIRHRLSLMFIVSIVTAVLNASLLLVSQFEPLRAHQELRYAVLSIHLQTWFFIGGCLAFAYDRAAIATLSVVAGVMFYLLVTRKYIRRLKVSSHRNSVGQ
jgi:O-antigen/teichoic acid export membrane protein